MVQKEFCIVEDVQIETPIKNKPDQTTRDVTEILHMSPISFVRHLTTLAYDSWMSHGLIGQMNAFSSAILCLNAIKMMHF